MLKFKAAIIDGELYLSIENVEKELQLEEEALYGMINVLILLLPQVRDIFGENVYFSKDDMEDTLFVKDVDEAAESAETWIPANMIIILVSLNIGFTHTKTLSLLASIANIELLQAKAGKLAKDKCTVHNFLVKIKQTQLEKSISAVSIPDKDFEEYKKLIDALIKDRNKN